MAEFTNDVQHVSGRDNVVADALSRTPTIAAVLSPEINFRQLAADQATSDDIHAYRTAIMDLKLEDVTFQDFTVLCDISTGYIRPIVPREDIVGPLPESMTYLFTIVDRYTRWAEVIPMAGCSTETCIKGFLRH